MVTFESQRANPKANPSRAQSAARSSSTPVNKSKGQPTPLIADDGISSQPTIQRLLRVHASPVQNRDEYVYYEPKPEVKDITRKSRKDGKPIFRIDFFDGQKKQVTLDTSLKLYGGKEALENTAFAPSASGGIDNMRLRNTRLGVQNDEFVDISKIAISSSENDDDDFSAKATIRGRGNRLFRKQNRGCSQHSGLVQLSTSEDDSDDIGRRRGRKRKAVAEPARRSTRQSLLVRSFNSSGDNSEQHKGDSSASDVLRTDLLSSRKRRRGAIHTSRVEYMPRNGVRQSNRSTRTTKNMQEAGMNNVYRSDSSDEPKAATQKMTVVREVFAPLPRSNLFRSRHVEACGACFNGPNLVPLIYCQGCSLAYHKTCLGNRSTRGHLVTKVGDENFVLQCKRCISYYQSKDATAPDLSKCQDCTQSGTSCSPFRRRTTTVQEMKARENNDGEDPIIHVPSHLINNPHSLLFRCTKCSRAWHYHHLPPLFPCAMEVNRNDEELADEHFRKYSSKWLCKECEDMGVTKVGLIVAWRPSDVETYRHGTACAQMSEDDKQYLIKWENQSYFRSAWFSGAWTWGVTTPAMRKAFFKREDGLKMRTEDAVPEDYLRIDIVLDIKYTNFVDVHTEDIDRARIKKVDRALIKYKGLGYEDVVWETVPNIEDGERWLDFVTAYNDWVAGRYIRYPKQSHLEARIEKVRNTPFAKLEREKQPENVAGGELMKYQVDGLNWLYYQWYSQRNGILADEMGLGKTIQVISFIATLIQEHECFPFLIVAPNSTCANWRREIKQWAPSLRVVAYFGSAQARNMTYKYELYPQSSKDIRCHVVVTSYEAASDDTCRRFFRSVSWRGLIVDEGQRLKNDKSQLYTALTAVSSPFRLLLTGTPLQNNARELFNLLQFLDDNISAAELEETYAEMTSENIKELHDEIRPFILRRTKAQVLTFLPPIGQVILPISMSHLQKQLYKSILSKSPELLKALFTSAKTLKQQERANLSNILMALRKCLCHPFVYNQDIEERTDSAAVLHRNLVEASAKLSLLELLLPKLKERGHRVLIFSQFLDMLSIIEDFLDGMQLTYQRMDGTMGSLEKQKRIDQFNAPDSPLFAFLLSTRAGGVGINLATADTVIILDPDWNPHQDLQAIARAHRIGQKKKVLCLQLMTRASVEEKILQMGRQKMALDHVVVEQMDTEDIEEKDVQSILKFGAAELFADDDTEHDIRYDDASIEKLLDRSQIRNTKISRDETAESEFSFARIWANAKGGLQDDFDITKEEKTPDPGVWDRILKERQAAAATEALARAEAMGRGRRAKAAVDYANEKNGFWAPLVAEEDFFEDSIAIAFPAKEKRKKEKCGSGSDMDFQIENEEEESEADEPMPDVDAGAEFAVVQPTNNSSKPLPHKTAVPDTSSMMSESRMNVHVSNNMPLNSMRPVVANVLPDISPTDTQRSANFRPLYPLPAPKAPKTTCGTTEPFRRVELPTRSPLEPTYGSFSNRQCAACHKTHPQGACELKVSGVEHCGLCNLAHYGHSRTCPHIKSETQVREMLLALKSSPESTELVDLATKYLRGVEGTLVQQNKRDREKMSLTTIPGMPLQAPPIGRPPYNTCAQSTNAIGRPPQPNFSADQTPLQAVSASAGSHIQGQPSQSAKDAQPSPPNCLDNHQVAAVLRGSLRH